MEYQTEREKYCDMLAEHKGKTIALAPLTSRQNYTRIEIACQECSQRLWCVFAAEDSEDAFLLYPPRVLLKRVDVLAEGYARYDVYAGICSECGTLYWTHRHRQRYD